jgi:hypothetical protein
MLVVLALPGKLLANHRSLLQTNDFRSHIKGKASHKIVSDGKSILVYISID